MRVVSLVPSVTETLLAWGVDVVACTRFCEQPDIAHVGGTKDPDIDAIVALAPDLVVVDREENRRDDADSLTARGVALHVTHVTSLADVGPMLSELARCVGLDQAATTPGSALPVTAPWTSAFIPIWRRPWMTINAATYGSSLLEHLGVTNVFADEVASYPTVDLDTVARLDPRLVLLPSEPYSFAERHRTELAAALPQAKVMFIDGQDLFWWGVRSAGAQERLRDALRAATTPC